MSRWALTASLLCLMRAALSATWDRQCSSTASRMGSESSALHCQLLVGLHDMFQVGCSRAAVRQA